MKEIAFSIILILATQLVISCKDESFSRVDNQLKFQRYDTAKKITNAYLTRNKTITDAEKSWCYNALGFADLFSNNFALAEQNFETSNKLNKNYFASFYMGVIDIEKNDFKAALINFSDSYDIFKNEKKAILERIKAEKLANHCYGKKAFFDKYIKADERSIENTNSTILFNKMMCAFALKDYNLGKRFFLC